MPHIRQMIEQVMEDDFILNHNEENNKYTIFSDGRLVTFDEVNIESKHLTWLYSSEQLVGVIISGELNDLKKKKPKIPQE